MTRADRFVLVSCVLAIAASAGIGAALVARRPGAEPWVKDAEARFERERATAKEPPPPAPRFKDAWARTDAGRESRDSTAMYWVPPVVERPRREPDPAVVEIDPVAVLGGGSAGQDGAAVAWTIEDPPVALERHESRKRAKVKGFVIERSREGKTFETIAEAGPEARSWQDRTAEPRATYLYRVRVAGGRDSVVCRSCLRAIAVPRGREREAAEVRTPSPFRVRLVGGDAKVGIFRVDAYDRRAAAWKGANHTARPGEGIGPSGWRLEALAFEKSLLVAEVVDDEAASRKLSTRD